MYNISLEIRHLDPSENSPNRVKCHKIVMEFSLPDGIRKTRTKETVSELIKREMGLHTDDGQRKTGFLDAKWNARCNELMAEDSRFLEFDKSKPGIKLALADADFLLNPFQVICPVCAQIAVLSSMNQLRALVQHLKEKHDALAADILIRLKAWMSNNFITIEQMDEKANLTSTLISPATVLSCPRAREAVLARDIF